MSSSTSRHHVRTTDLTWREVDDEVVVLDLASSRYLALNGSGAKLWHSLVDGAATDELTGLLVDEYALGADQAGRDVEQFLVRCTEMGLLET